MLCSRPSRQPLDAADGSVAGGASIGSRGSRTFQAVSPTRTAPRGVAPIERSMTDRGWWTMADGEDRPAAEAGVTLNLGAAGGLLIGGLIGAGLFGLVSASGSGGDVGSGAASGGAGFATFIGSLAQFVVIGFLVGVLIRFFRVRTQAVLMRAAASLPGSTSPRDFLNRMRQSSAVDADIAASGAPGPVGAVDFARFQGLLQDVHEAFGHEDTEALGTMATPEMLSYLSLELAENAKAGLHNELSGAKLLQGDLAEAWHEVGSDYATMPMRYSVVDALVERATDRVIAGDRATPRSVTGVWTFRRDHRDMAQGWQVSAIQQVAAA